MLGPGLVLAAAAVVLWVRLLPLSLALVPEEQRDLLRYRGADGREHVYLGDFDSYLWVREARNVVRTGTTCDAVVAGECRDTYADAPVGAPMRYARSLHVTAIVALHRVLDRLVPGIPLTASAYWVPVVVERATWLTLPDSSVNQSRPSGPVVMATGEAAPVLVLNSAKPVPLGVIVAIVLAPASVNHRLPSGPVVMPSGSLVAVWEIPAGRNSVMVPVTAAGRATAGAAPAGAAAAANTSACEATVATRTSLDTDVVLCLAVGLALVLNGKRVAIPHLMKRSFLGRSLTMAIATLVVLQS